METIGEWFKGGLGLVWYWLTNVIVLSLGRLVLFGWLGVVLYDLVVRVFQHDLDPPLGTDFKIAALTVVVGLLGSVFMWWWAEQGLDQARHSHRQAYEVKLPQATTKLHELENELKLKERELLQTCRQLQQTFKELEAKKSANEDNLNRLTHLQLELNKTTAELKTTELNLQAAQAATAEARVRQAQAEQRANTATGEAYNRLLTELDPVITNLGEFRNGVLVKLKAASSSGGSSNNNNNSLSASASSLVPLSLSVETVTHPDQDQKGVPQPARKNYV